MPRAVQAASHDSDWFRKDDDVRWQSGVVARESTMPPSDPLSQKEFATPIPTDDKALAYQ
jgi:hypothetical protein